MYFESFVLSIKNSQNGAQFSLHADGEDSLQPQRMWPWYVLVIELWWNQLTSICCVFFTKVLEESKIDCSIFNCSILSCSECDITILYLCFFTPIYYLLPIVMISLELLGHDICFPRSFKMSCNDRGVESGVEREKTDIFQIVSFTYTHRIHVWYAYQHLVDGYGKCRSYMDPMGYRFCWL